MKSHNILLCLILMVASCTKHKKYVPFAPKESDYHAIVNINGVDVRKWIRAEVNVINGYDMVFKSYETQTGLYHIIDIANIPIKSGVFNLHTIFNDSTLAISFCTVDCCAEEPDYPVNEYDIYEPDSLHNYFRLHIDTVTQEASGMFKATYYSTYSANDFLHVQCDTFYCKYTKY